MRAAFKETHRPMKLNARIPVSFALVLLLGTVTGCNKLKSHDQITKGVQAFKNAQYDQAVSYFQNAVKLDPTSENARLYLATAYAYQVVPNLESPENLALAQKALNGFNEILAKDPKDINALKQIASIDRNIGRDEQAKEYEKKVIALDPNDAEAYYTVGYVDWALAYKKAREILAKDGLVDDGNGNVKMTKAACAQMQQANGPLVTEGIQYLQKAIDINPNYDDAMTELQLTYRRKADMECGNDAARKADLAKADELIQRAMGARKQNELEKEKKAGGGVQM